MFAARMTMLILAAVVALTGEAKTQLKALDGDWPGWMGPDRTGVSPETGLLKQWPKARTQAAVDGPRRRGGLLDSLIAAGQDLPDQQSRARP